MGKTLVLGGRQSIIYAIKATIDIEPFFYSLEKDRHMTNSPYPAKNRGKGKRNKY